VIGAAAAARLFLSAVPALLVDVIQLGFPLRDGKAQTPWSMQS